MLVSDTKQNHKYVCNRAYETWQSSIKSLKFWMSLIIYFKTFWYLLQFLLPFVLVLSNSPFFTCRLWSYLFCHCFNSFTDKGINKNITELSFSLKYSLFLSYFMLIITGMGGRGWHDTVRFAISDPLADMLVSGSANQPLFSYPSIP